MNCETIRAHELAQRYVLGQLTAEERDGYEQHYFDCESCFGELQTIQTIQAVLGSGFSSPKKWTLHTERPRTPAWQLGAIAAAIVLAGVIGWRFERTAGSPPVVTTERSTPAPAPARSGELQLLAQVSPPAYHAPVLRGGAPAGGQLFRAAMQSYARQDYLAAMEGLAASVRQNPSAPAPRFYLAVCHLLVGQPTQAVPILRDTIALGDTAYLEAAHFYLAKAFVGSQDLLAARRELQAAVALHGDREQEAQSMLAKLNSIQP